MQPIEKGITGRETEESDLRHLGSFRRNQTNLRNNSELAFASDRIFGKSRLSLLLEDAETYEN